MADAPATGYVSGRALLPKADPLPESQGPWSLPPAPRSKPRPAPPAERGPRHLPVGLVIWLALICGAVGAYFAFVAILPDQAAAIDQADALKLLGLFALVSTGAVFARRAKLADTVRNIAIWLGVSAAALVGYAYRNELADVARRVESAVLPSFAVSDTPREMTVSASDDGGFYVQGEVNGAPVRFAIDTGASGIVLSPADARRAGIDLKQLDFAGPSETANGVAQMAPAIASSVDVGPMRLSDVKVVVDKAPMSASLLGMDFLRRLDSIEMRGDRLTMKWRS